MVSRPLIAQGYSLAEEVANSISHGIGLVFGIVGLVLLLVQAVDTNASAMAITSYSLYGENFTKSSKVYVNGEKQKSTFLNNTRIVLPSTELSEGDVITVSQVGSSNTIFRTTDEYIYQGGQLVRQEGTGTDTTKSWTEQENEEK